MILESAYIVLAIFAQPHTKQSHIWIEWISKSYTYMLLSSEPHRHMQTNTSFGEHRWEQKSTEVKIERFVIVCIWSLHHHCRCCRRRRRSRIYCTMYVVTREKKEKKEIRPFRSESSSHEKGEEMENNRPKYPIRAVFSTICILHTTTE